MTIGHLNGKYYDLRGFYGELKCAYTIVIAAAATTMERPICGVSCLKQKILKKFRTPPKYRKFLFLFSLNKNASDKKRRFYKRRILIRTLTLIQSVFAIASRCNRFSTLSCSFQRWQLKNRSAYKQNGRYVKLIRFMCSSRWRAWQIFKMKLSQIVDEFATQHLTQFPIKNLPIFHRLDTYLRIWYVSFGRPSKWSIFATPVNILSSFSTARTRYWEMLT